MLSAKQIRTEAWDDRGRRAEMNISTGRFLIYKIKQLQLKHCLCIMHRGLLLAPGQLLSVDALQAFEVSRKAEARNNDAYSV